MSPREVVEIGAKKAATGFGVEGYFLPKVGSPTKIKVHGISKSKNVNMIDQI